MLYAPHRLSLPFSMYVCAMLKWVCSAHSFTHNLSLLGILLPVPSLFVHLTPAGRISKCPPQRTPHNSRGIAGNFYLRSYASCNLHNLHIAISKNRNAPFPTGNKCLHVHRGFSEKERKKRCVTCALCTRVLVDDAVCWVLARCVKGLEQEGGFMC